MRNVTCLWTCLQEFMSLLLCILAICQICCTTSDDDEYPHELPESQTYGYSGKRKSNENKTPVPNRASMLIKTYTELLKAKHAYYNKFVEERNKEIQGLHDYNSGIISSFVENAIDDLSNNTNTTVGNLLKSIVLQVRQFYHITLGNVSDMLGYLDDSVMHAVILSFDQIDSYTKTCDVQVKHEIQFYGNVSAYALTTECAKNIKTISQKSAEKISAFSETGNTLVTGLLKDGVDGFKKFTAKSEVYLKKMAEGKQDAVSANLSAEDLKRFTNMTVDKFGNLSNRITNEVYSVKNRTAVVLPVLAEIKAYSVMNLTQHRPGHMNLTAGKFNLKRIEESIDSLSRKYKVLPREKFDEILSSIRFMQV